MAPARMKSPKAARAIIDMRAELVAEARKTTDSCVTGIGAPAGGSPVDPAGRAPEAAYWLWALYPP